MKIAVSLLLLLALTGCSTQAAERALQEQDRQAIDEVMAVEFSIEDSAGNAATTFRQGSAAEFVFRVVNRSAESQRLSYTFPPHRVKVVSAATGEIVWEAHYGQMFPQVMREDVIAPGDAAEFTVEWSFTAAGDTDARVPAGKYIVQPEFNGFLAGKNKLDAALEPRRIVLQE